MTLVKFLINGLEAELVSAKVRRNHDRTVDSSEFKISTQYEIDQGDKVTYIQDIVDTTFLTAIWNFHYSARDEAGNDIDGNDGTYTADFIQSASLNYVEDISPVLRFNAINEYVTVIDNSRINFSKQFEIDIICSPEIFPTGLMTIFSKTNGDAGGGIEIGITSGDPGYVEVELFDTVGILTTLTGTNVNLRDGNYHFIRIKRNGIGEILLTVDGITEGSTTKNNAVDDYTATGINIFFGKNFDVGSRHYQGKIAQIRIYCNGTLSDDDYDTTRFDMRQPMTMKFRGIVQNYENNVGFKTVYAQSVNELIINAKISKANMDLRDKNATNNGIDNIFLDDVTNRMTTDLIVKQILAELDSGYIFHNATGTGEIMNRYIARGTLSEIISQLFTLDNRRFWITPRKVLVKENQPISTKKVFEQGLYDINVDGKDNTLLINDVEAVGEVQIHNRTQQFNGDGVITAFTLTNVPIRVKADISAVVKLRGIDSNDSVGKDYYIEYTNGATSGSRIIFFVAPAVGTNNITVEYDYENTSTLYFRSEDATSITDFGRVSGRVYAPGFDQGQLASLVLAILTDRKTPKRRITVVSSTLLNSIREGLGCNILYPEKNINDTFELKSIEWRYPQGITIMEFGEHKFGYFDIIQSGNTRLSGVDDFIIKTNNI